MGMLEQDIRHRPQVGPGIGGPGRIGWRVQDQPLGPRRNGPGKILRIQAETAPPFLADPNRIVMSLRPGLFEFVEK